MTFRIHALPYASFAPLFALDAAGQGARNIHRMTVAEHPGTPCRVSLEDVEVGEEVLLLNHAHLDLPSPYAASHAIFVREGARQAYPDPGEVPDVLARRLLSLRGFDADGMMRDAEVTEGTGAAAHLDRMLDDPGVAFVDLHNARQGCFAARARRT